MTVLSEVVRPSTVTSSRTVAPSGSGLPGVSARSNTVTARMSPPSSVEVRQPSDTREVSHWPTAASSPSNRLATTAPVCGPALASPAYRRLMRVSSDSAGGGGPAGGGGGRGLGQRAVEHPGAEPVDRAGDPVRPALAGGPAGPQQALHERDDRDRRGPGLA